jgi:flagellar biosynthetic protein FliR
MIQFTEAQILAWITPLLWPFLRALALFSSLPVLGTRTCRCAVRIGLAGFIALAAQPRCRRCRGAAGLAAGVCCWSRSRS